MPRFYGAHSSYGVEPDAQSIRYRELANALTDRRIKDAEETGADVLVTACTGCQRTLGLMAQKSGAKIKVRMLSEVLADLLV
jgi:Fe-S oxidoreductase